MNIITAEFIKGSTSLNQCPVSEMPEFAFIGRSNVGKSSLINMISGKRKLAKVSQTPGKTRQINHFLINGEWLLADLPGYGFARMPKTEREKMEKMIAQYLGGRKNLRLTFLLVDSRHAPQAIDIDFMKWMNTRGIPFAILFTKTDKLSRSQLLNNQRAYETMLSELFHAFPEIIPTSVMNKKGKDEILGLIQSERETISPRRHEDTEIL